MELYVNIKMVKKAFLKNNNEEQSQAIVRLIFAVVFAIYFPINMFYFHEDKITPVLITIYFIFTSYSIIQYLLVKRDPSKNHLRRMIAMFIDVCVVSTAVYYLDGTGLVLFSAYLWIIVGYGMRFGIKYLLVATIFVVIQFATLLLIHPFWIQNPQIGIGLMGVIILLPIFVFVLMKRLVIANAKLQEQLTLQKTQENILIQQSRHAAMGEMISNIAHQWRQPLNALGLLLQNLESAYEMNMLDKTYITRTIEKGTRLTKTMSNTIDDFRDFFKPNKEKEYFNIDEIIQRSLEIVESTVESNDIEVIIDMQKENKYYGYPNEFSQVLLNILSNAQDILLEKKTQERKIWINLYTDNNSYIIEIRDNGGGIPDDIINKIFDPYFTTKDKDDGTGIGLYMSKLIIEEYLDGKLDATNHKDGAQFRIILNKIDAEEKV